MLKIGEREFKYKKDALFYYKKILHSYNFNESLNNDDFADFMDLVIYDESFEEFENDFSEAKIVDVRIGRAQFNTKCFEIIWDDNTSVYPSYISMINRPKKNLHSWFSVACRNAIQKDLTRLKQKYFAENAIEGFVKCQETNELAKWDDLAVDHRQPNTFSMIVDRFKEINSIDVFAIEYIVDENNFLIFKDEMLSQTFQIYHKHKANLRIVKKERNLARTSMARIGRTSKDLKIE